MEEKYGKTLLGDLELWEYAIKPALLFEGTPEDLGFERKETLFGEIFIKYPPKKFENSEFYRVNTK